MRIGLSADKREILTRRHEAWAKARGRIKGPVTDTASSIDTILYGENGAWRGTMPDTNEAELEQK